MIQLYCLSIIILYDFIFSPSLECTISSGSFTHILMAVLIFSDRVFDEDVRTSCDIVMYGITFILLKMFIN